MYVWMPGVFVFEYGSATDVYFYITNVFLTIATVRFPLPTFYMVSLIKTHINNFSDALSIAINIHVL